MSDLPSNLLLQQEHAKPKTGEELEVLGKEAAAKYGRGECKTLTEAVLETVKTAHLSPEQVRRVVEFTNVTAFNDEFKKEGSGHRIVEFVGGPADFPEILKDLNDGGTEQVIDKHAFDYSAPPPDVAKLYARNEDRLGLENTKLAEAFGAEEVALPYADPMRDVLDMRDKLAGAEQELATELTYLESQYTDVLDDLYRNVKQASLEGIELGQILQVWTPLSGHPEFIKSAFAHLAPRLVENEVFRSTIDIADSITKVASGMSMVNVGHPLVVRFKDYCETLTKLAETRRAHQDISEQLDRVTTFAKSAAGNAAAAKELLGKAWGASKDVARDAAPMVGGALRTAGNVAADVAETTIPYVPHAAVGYGGLKGVEAARESPTVQKALSYVPGTKQHTIRKYYQQQQRGYR